MPTLNELLTFDGLSVAEEITGESYKDDQYTESLGFGLMMLNNTMKQRALTELGDSVLQNNLNTYIEIITRIDFEKVAEFPFSYIPSYARKGEQPRNECQYIFANRELGILLIFDTYDATRVNGGNFHYCIKFDTNPSWDIVSSGHYESIDQNVEKPDYRDLSTVYWSGDHDCREAIVHKIDRLKEHGEFLPIWPKNHNRLLYISFMSYGDWHNVESLTSEDKKVFMQENYQTKLNVLPDWVKEMIGETK